MFSYGNDRRVFASNPCVIRSKNTHRFRNIHRTNSEVRIQEESIEGLINVESHEDCDRFTEFRLRANVLPSSYLFERAFNIVIDLIVTKKKKKETNRHDIVKIDHLANTEHFFPFLFFNRQWRGKHRVIHYNPFTDAHFNEYNQRSWKTREDHLLVCTYTIIITLKICRLRTISRDIPDGSRTFLRLYHGPVRLLGRVLTFPSSFCLRIQWIIVRNQVFLKFQDVLFLNVENGLLTGSGRFHGRGVYNAILRVDTCVYTILQLFRLKSSAAAGTIVVDGNRGYYIFRKCFSQNQFRL